MRIWKSIFYMNLEKKRKKDKYKKNNKLQDKKKTKADS